jgi:putative membrane-bound dehydrogenase-like protein
MSGIFVKPALLISLTLACSTVTALAQQARQQVTIGEINFTVPAGYDLQSVASEKLIKWPVVVDWDGAGNLLVVECGGVSKPIVEHNKLMLHRLVRLLDTDGDGHFDKRVVVADQLPLTQGVLWIGGDILVSSPPNILRLIDEDGDGVCEKRDVWFDGQTITGCANDLHGPYMGRDGWIYWCKGAFAEQNHELVNGKRLNTTAAHIFRRRVEGGPIEAVMTGGMDNPVEVAFSPAGERFFTSTFLQNPGNGLRDGIAHAIYGGVYGKPNNVLDGHPRTGSLMPIMTQLGAAAPSGLICLRSNQLVQSQLPNQSTLVAALFNLQKVTAHLLQPVGASFTTLDQDLVVGDRIDFHPTDVLEDADGSLLVIDTGGWYDLCCPTSRIDQKTASGGIYRLKRRDTSVASPGSANQALPLQQQITAQQIVAGLHDVRPWVARRFQLALPKLDPDKSRSVVKLLGDELHSADASQQVRLESLWGLCICGTQDAKAELVKAVRSEDPAVAQAACHAMSLYRFADAQSALEYAVQHASTPVRRSAAEALGRIGSSKSIDSLMKGIEVDDADRALMHSVTFAIMEINSVESVLPYASASSSPRQQQVAMIAVDQLGAADRLPVEFMVAALTASDQSCAVAAAELLGKHPEWAEKYASQIKLWFAEALTQEQLPRELLSIARPWRNTGVVLGLMADWLDQVARGDVSTQERTIEMFGLYAGSALDKAWSAPVANWLNEASPEVRARLVDQLAKMDLAQATEVQAALLKLAKESSDPVARLQLLASLPGGTRAGDLGLEQSVLNALQSDESSNAQWALLALKRIQLTNSGGTQLLARLKDQQPRTLAVAVEAINRLGDDQLDQTMLETLAELPAARTLSMDQLRNAYRNRNSSLRGLADKTVAELSRSSEDIQSQVAATLNRLGPGDPIRGLQLFRSNKAQCSGCHRLGYVGGEIGPELTRIGGSRTREALLEAILFPSARLEQSYQSTKVLTVDGQIYNGLIKRQDASGTVELQLTVDKTITLKTEDIERQEPSSVSIMPAGMLELLTIDELSDLLALLESGK